MQELKKNFLNSVLAIFIVVYTIALLFLAKNTVIWEDEVYSLHTTSQTVSYAFEQSYKFEGQPPAYFILLNVWRKMSDSLFFARVFSLVFTLLTGLTIYKISKNFLNHETTVIITALFLLNPSVVYFSMEARLYALIIFLSALSFLLFYKAYLVENSKKISVLFHVLVSILGVFTQYFFVLVLLSQALSLLIISGWRRFLKYSIVHTAVALIFSINFLIIPNQLNAASNEYIKIDLVYFKKYLRSLQNFLFCFNRVDFSLAVRRLIIFGYIIWLISLFKRHRSNLKFETRQSGPFIFIFLNTIVVYLLLIILINKFKINYEERYISILYPGLFFIFIYSLTLMDKRHFVLCAAIIFIHYGVVNYNSYGSFVKNYDYEQIAGYVDKVEKSDEPILFYLNPHALPFQYYYKGKNKVVPLPVAVDFRNSGYFKDIYITDTCVLNKTFEHDLKSYDSFIFISDNIDSIWGKSTNRQLVNNYLNRNFTVGLDTLVSGRSRENTLRIRTIFRH
jgi:4-amino-4-deoxy-L-arabinose transferase-like glycosyltransferase